MPQKYQLPNGMKVLLQESHKSPVVSVQMWVKTGSADERKGEEGISHFIEHLVFKGSRRYGVGEIAAVVEGSGGELNAYTSFDQTVFYVTISKQFVDVALDVVSEMMGFPTFDQAEIDNEREVVIEEIKRTHDSAGRRASRVLFSTAYQQHPYGIPVIGYEKNIRAVSRKKLQAYYYSRYVPTNMFLVVSGDFASAEMKRKVQKLFAFPKQRKRAVVRKKERPQSKARIKMEVSDFQETHVHMGWRIPKVSHRDIPALELFAAVLGQGESSRLVRRLRLVQPVVNYTSASTFTSLDPGLLAISATLNPQNLNTFLLGLKEEVVRVLAEGVTAEELQRAVIGMESEEYYGMETVDGLARKAGTFEFLMNDYNYFPKYLRQIYQVTTQDIQRVARKYINVQQMVVTALLAKNSQTDAIKAHTQQWLKGFAQDVKVAVQNRPPVAKRSRRQKSWRPAPGKARRAPSVEEIALPGGGKIFLFPNRETPVLSAKIAHLGGARWESEALAGVTEMVARTWRSGTQQRNEEQISAQMEDWASHVGAFGGRNSAGITADALKAFEQPVAELFFEVLAGPSFPEEAIEREKQVLVEQIKSQKDHPAQLAIQGFLRTLFPGHPYGRDLKGSESSVQSLQRAQVAEHWRKMAQSKDFVMVVTGDCDPKIWRAGVQSYLQKWRKKDPAAAAIPKNPLQYPNQEIKNYEFLQREQTHIVLGYPGLQLADPRRYVVQLLQALLSGQGGRLFIELRDKASLAYSVSPLHMEGLDGGYFGAYIGCSPEKGRLAIEMLQVEFRKLADELVSEDELARARRNLIGQHDINLQKNTHVASAILFNELYHLPYQEIFDYASRLQEVTAPDLRAVAQEILSRPAVMHAVGASSPF